MLVLCIVQYGNSRRSSPPGRRHVYGANPCGIITAVAAAREGAKVLLINPQQHVGGLSTSGLNTAETEHMLKWTFGGIALEFYQRLGKHYGTDHAEFFFESSVAEQVVYLEMLKEGRRDGAHGPAAR